MSKAIWRVYCDTLEEIQEAIENPEFVRPMIIEGAKRLLSSRKKMVEVAELLSLDTLATIRISLREEEVVEVLQKTADWMLEREEYEELIEIRNLLERAHKREARSRKAPTGRRHRNNLE